MALQFLFFYSFYLRFLVSMKGTAFQWDAKKKIIALPISRSNNERGCSFE